MTIRRAIATGISSATLALSLAIAAPALAQAANVRASIPLTQPVESLNVAVAAGVLLYEARRQRK